jgi:hypothetical protein
VVTMTAPRKRSGPGLGTRASSRDIDQDQPSTALGQFVGDDDPFELADKPAEVEDQAPAEDQAEEQAPAKLQPHHLAELRSLRVDDDTIARLKIQTYYDHRGAVGWSFDWTDGVDHVHALIPDRDKRRGPKVEWPKGQTLIVGCIRWVEGATRSVIVEGPRQALALAAYAPPDVAVFVMNGSNGIHAKIRDRLSRTFAGDVVTIVTDADWRSNDQVGRAATEACPGPEPGRPGTDGSPGTRPTVRCRGAGRSRSDWSRSPTRPRSRRRAGPGPGPGSRPCSPPIRSVTTY